MVHPTLRSFEAFLKLEKGLSISTLEAYLRDLQKLIEFLDIEQNDQSIESLSIVQLQEFIAYLNEIGLSARSQARMISSLKSFYRFLVIEELITEDPTLLLSSPKLEKALPSVLAHHEIDKLIAAIDHSTREGIRNRAILEVLYACGIRVSELCNLKLSNSYLEAGYLKILGKGNKERLVPIGDEAIKHLNFYLQERAKMNNINEDAKDIIFLNRRGKKISRNMIFMIVKSLAQNAGIDRNISPHTFRHTFATHLIEGGANLKVVQDLLGHRSIITTEIYTHLDMSYLKETIKMFHPRNS